MSQAAPTARVSSLRAEAIAYRPPYLWALAPAAALFVLYALTLAPTTAFWDTSEYIATAHIVGIPHPPGNPAFVLLARAWELLLAPFGLPVAVRINLFSAFMTAGASYFWFLVVHRILAWFTPEELARRVGAAAAVVVSGTAFTVWNQANVNEKVYTVTLFTMALLSWVAFRWRDRVEETEAQRGRRWHSDNAVIFVVYVLALSVGNHKMAVLALPALGVFLLLVKWRILADWRIYPLAIAAVVLGMSIQLMLPIRANQDPVINEAAPKCERVGAALAVVLTDAHFGREGCPALHSSIKREQYGKPPVTTRQAPFGFQMANFLQYFDWQWSRSLGGTSGYFHAFRFPFTLLFGLLGIYGAFAHWGRDRKSFWYIATLFGTLSVGLVVYMNFKYGYVQGQMINQDYTEVRERDYFYVCTFSVWGLWVGVGLTALWLRLSESIGRARPARSALLQTMPLMAVALIPLWTNWAYASRQGDYAARDFAFNLLQSVEPYGVLITNGDNDTFPLWYLQEVEGVRRDVTVIVMSYFNTAWYVKQLRDLTRPCERPGQADEDPTLITCQRPYDAAHGPKMYGTPRTPARPILPLTDAQIDQTAGGYAIVADENTVYEARGMQFRVEPGTQLDPAHQFLTMMLQGAWGDRPIHFAATTFVHAEMGLLPHTARHGMTFKLVTPEEVRMAGMTPMPPTLQVMQFTGGFMDVDRNRVLLEREAQYHGLEARKVWADDATRNIPMQYTYAFLALSQGEQVRSQAARAARDETRAQGYEAQALRDEQRAERFQKVVGRE